MENRLNLIKSKIFQPKSLSAKLSLWRFHGLSIVFTNGCFDIMHRGHVEYLCNAASLGDVLVVGVNDDASVRKLNKGKNRPVNDLYSRMLMLASLQFVGAVIPFSEDTPEHLIHSIEPEVLVKGGDYNTEETDKNSKKYIVGSDRVKSNGGLVQTIPFVDGFSTTDLIKRINQA